jgi:ribosomal protein RSM22 (predicted rRNA methylase)
LNYIHYNKQTDSLINVTENNDDRYKSRVDNQTYNEELEVLLDDNKITYNKFIQSLNQALKDKGVII